MLCRLAVLMICPFFMASCSLLEHPYGVETVQVRPKTRLLPHGRPVTNLPAIGEELVERLISTGKADSIGLKDRTLVVTTFVDLDNLEHTTPLGRTLQEVVMNALIRRGYGVKEIRGANALNVSQGSGELILSRSPGELPSTVVSQLVITGTISETPATVIVNMRLFDFSTRISLAAVSVELIKSPIIMDLLKQEKLVDPLVFDRMVP